MTRLIAACALILTWGMTLSVSVQAASELVRATSFKADARTAAQRKVPVMVLFSSPSCSYCDRVKNEYLGPMHRDPAYRTRAIFREVSVNGSTPMTDFDGTVTTEATFAAEHKVYMVPTVKVFDVQGNEVGDPIVGLLIADFYFGYLEAAIDNGIRKVRSK